ncbi:MAG: hypothetical protein NVS2B7_27270 [Herpetosiphon sp.]
MTKQVVGLFSSMHDAEATVRDLHSAGFSERSISLVAHDTSAASGGHQGTHAGKDAVAGATGGGVLGGLTGLLVGLGALAIPGIGPVIAGGALATALGTAATGAAIGAAGGGLIGGLVGAGIPENDAHVYAEGVRRGGALVTVEADDRRANEAAQIMDRHNVQDIDNVGQQYRSGGWSRFDENAGEYSATGTHATGSSDRGSGVGTGVGTLSGAATGAAIGSVGGPIGTVIGGVAGAVTGAGIGAAGDKVGAEVAHGGEHTHATDTTTHDTSRIGSATDVNYRETAGTTNRHVGTHEGETAIPVIEEQLNVGKREVEGGGVRVNTHVTERPVTEQVTLHEERVDVERRPVNREVHAGELNQVREGTFEVREHSEVPIVEKTARVVEEVVINKEAHDRTERVQDTVRRTDVEVEKLSGTTTGHSTTGTSAGNSVEHGAAHAANAVERGLSKAENAAERATNTDLNRDGDVGRSKV